VAETVTLQLPSRLYERLVNTAQATKWPLEEIIIHSLEVGSPPDWEDVPEEFQSDLAALDRLDDDRLWQIARSQKSESDFEQYDELLERNREGTLTDSERLELAALRRECDRFMLCNTKSTCEWYRWIWLLPALSQVRVRGSSPSVSFTKVFGIKWTSPL
jgi:hypothetical protein